VAHAAAAAISLTWIASSKRLSDSVARRPLTAANLEENPGSELDQNTRPQTSYVAIKPGSPAQVIAPPAVSALS
jgi:hypothetical protein